MYLLLNPDTRDELGSIQRTDEVVQLPTSSGFVTLPVGRLPQNLPALIQTVALIYVLISLKIKDITLGPSCLRKKSMR
jgi:hypothetical protein